MQHYLLALFFVFLSATSFAQTKNFIDQPYIEVNAKADTLVAPDVIYLSIILHEKDKRNKVSVEELESRMAERLENLNINLKEQLTLSDVSSNFKKYFLKQTDILKSKSYQLKVYDTQTAGKVIVQLEEAGISNVYLTRTEYAEMDNLILELKSRAVAKAKQNAEHLLKPLNQVITKAIYITDNSNYDYNMNLNDIVVKGYASKEKKTYTPLDIEFEPIKVSAQVLVKFAIE